MYKDTQICIYTEGKLQTRHHSWFSLYLMKRLRLSLASSKRPSASRDAPPIRAAFICGPIPPLVISVSLIFFSLIGTRIEKKNKKNEQQTKKQRDRCEATGTKWKKTKQKTKTKSQPHTNKERKQANKYLGLDGAH